MTRKEVAEHNKKVHAYKCEQRFTFGDRHEPEVSPQGEPEPIEFDENYEARLMALPGTARYKAIRTSISMTPPPEEN